MGGAFTFWIDPRASAYIRGFSSRAPSDPRRSAVPAAEHRAPRSGPRPYTATGSRPRTVATPYAFCAYCCTMRCVLNQLPFTAIALRITCA